MVAVWKDRKEKASKSSDLFIKGEMELIDFSESGDLFEIMKWSKNWDEISKDVFKERKIFEADMEQVLMIRRDKAHSRELNEIQKNKLEAITLHLIALVDAYEKTKTTGASG
jgi:hypothetical protein